ncbi:MULTISPECIES: cytoplasmic filament protein CfpA [unclassified Treponema]|uniref:cytoplasmic filament protein CfpA n=1 Tax=unclassified Treponema TaxID=2638727 RepID=UPI0020A54E1C|nr:MULTISPECIES: cytoplasmic filament protein CfpA [unclassified Treponema]UTC67355.1 cytochrome C oxidase subunit II [Treponema sp. OMZ 789]UTC70083.1 cytochrome C oxidase subunit II [Treponema sp. OMZ 790]UTC72799.1 cytochrome C oxidase subunit II [Treponema sp. OMZ 791]
MANLDLPQSPNVFHPEKPSAVGSRNSLAQDYRDQQKEVNQLIEEETNKVLHHLTTKLPKEVLERLDIMGGVKEKLYNYFNQNYQNMFNRYMVTAEDEMLKKVRGFIDREEMKVLDRYTPKEIATLLDAVGGADKFNTGEIEKSIVNMYGHLQGHVQRGVNDLETLTNSLLRQKTDVGAFVRGENAYSIVKCAFKDNLYKPKTVTDVKLSVNILDTELISPIFQYQSTVEYLIKDLLSNHYMDVIDKEIEKIKDRRIDQGLDELSDGEIIFAKIDKVSDITDDDVENPKSKRYDVVSKLLMERINNLRAEIDPETFDQLNIRENIKKIIDLENIRNRGFNTAINSITSILDTSKMGYQYIENLKNARELILREYDDTDIANLPDERYQIRLKYYDNAQLLAERQAYEVMMSSFETEIQHLWDVVRATYDKSKFMTKITDFSDLAANYKKFIKRKYKDQSGEPVYEDTAKVWDEISFVKPPETEVEKMNRTYVYEKDKLRKKLIIMRKRMKDLYDYQYPIERRVIEDRLSFIEAEFNKFDYLINPFHIQPGLLLDLDITSIKRKKATLDGMANVLNEFLHGVSKGFADAAFASFSRRRSTVRADIAQSFAAADEDPKAGEVAGRSQFIDMINSTPAIEAPAAEAVSSPAKRRGPKRGAAKAKKTGSVDSGRGRRKAKSGIREI